MARNQLSFGDGMLVGMQRSREALERGQAGKVFDWDKAARMIVERGAQYAEAGLMGDWTYTGGHILEGGKPVPRDQTYTYLASLWATPAIVFDWDEGEIPCYIEQPCDWDSGTYWPESALAILESNIIEGEIVYRQLPPPSEED